MARKYELKRRAERQAETRRRIVAAAVDLHTSLGPARTSISAVAERAGVQRHTVYAHFPDVPSLFRACSAHWESLHPFPDVGRRLPDAGFEERLRAALDALYAWYEEVGDDLALFARDADALPDGVADDAERLGALRDAIARGQGRLAVAAVGHALELETWRSLDRQGLSRREAVDAMVRLAASV